MTSRFFREFNPGSFSWLMIVMASLFLAVLLGGCEGEQGPAGPAGPPGGSYDFVIEFLGSHPVLRADGESSMNLEARATTLSGNNIDGLNLKFSIDSGDGTVSPVSSVTNSQGIASCVFTAGRNPGKVLVSATIEVSGIGITDIAELFLDSMDVSGPLLSRDFADPLMAEWSHDGSFLVFQSNQYNDFNLFKVDGQGGVPAHLGTYRGGSCNPDGSGRIAAFGPESGGWPNDSQVFILDYDGQITGSGFRPDGFQGGLRGAIWCQDGDSVLVASNTNGILGVSDALGEAYRQLDLVLWASYLAAVPASPFVVAVGGSDELTGLFSLDLEKDSLSQLISGMSNSLKGASVDPGGISVIFSGRGFGEEMAVQNDIYSIPLTGGEPVEFLTSPVEELYPAWSPDGRKIVFCSDRSGSGYNLYVYTVPQ